MRKTLVQTLLAAFCAIPFALRSLGEGLVAERTPLEGGGVMLIGARNGMLAGGWKNPYPAMDSCITWWDGEWNTGNGRHDTNAHIWRDIIGGIEIQCPEFGDKYGLFDKVITNTTFSEDLYSQPFSVELISMPLGTVSGYQKYIFNLYNKYAMGYDARVQDTFMTKTPNSTNKSDSGTRLLWYQNGNEIWKDMIGKVQHSVCVWNSDAVSPPSCKLFWRTNQVQLGSQWNSSSDTTEQCSLGNDTITVRIYAVRIHSRALTASEIAANYAVDKARFNLP